MPAPTRKVKRACKKLCADTKRFVGAMSSKNRKSKRLTRRIFRKCPRVCNKKMMELYPTLH